MGGIGKMGKEGTRDEGGSQRSEVSVCKSLFFAGGIDVSLYFWWLGIVVSAYFTLLEIVVSAYFWWLKFVGSQKIKWRGRSQT